MSIFSEYACGALSDFEFEQECRRMNREDRYYEAMESASMYYTDDEFEGCPNGYAEVDEGDECIGCKFYDVCKECFESEVTG